MEYTLFSVKGMESLSSKPSSPGSQMANSSSVLAEFVGRSLHCLSLIIHQASTVMLNWVHTSQLSNNRKEKSFLVCGILSLFQGYLLLSYFYTLTGLRATLVSPRASITEQTSQDPSFFPFTLCHLSFSFVIICMTAVTLGQHTQLSYSPVSQHYFRSHYSQTIWLFHLTYSSIISYISCHSELD